ncbi:MAG: hypothetical protein V1846_04615 [Candidatus Komeilibacteria bacterium]
MPKPNIYQNVTNDDLALMIKEGFDGVDKRFGEVYKRFELVPTKVEMQREFQEVRQRLSRLEQDHVVVQKIKEALAIS